MIEDEKIFLRQNWITQRNTRGIGSIKNYMSAREDILFLTKTNDYTFNIPYLDEKSKRKDLGANGKPRKNTHKRVSNVWYDITEASQSISAIRNNRNVRGCEINPKYIELSISRIKKFIGVDFNGVD